MKSFKNIREAKSMPVGDHVFSKKINKHTVMIHKDKKGFSVYIDGDKLDTYRSQARSREDGCNICKGNVNEINGRIHRSGILSRSSPKQKMVNQNRLLSKVYLPQAEQKNRNGRVYPQADYGKCCG